MVENIRYVVGQRGGDRSDNGKNLSLRILRLLEEGGGCVGPAQHAMGTKPEEEEVFYAIPSPCMNLKKACIGSA